jgi:hypothetical protein
MSKPTVKYSLGYFSGVGWNSRWPVNLLILYLVWAKIVGENKTVCGGPEKKTTPRPLLRLGGPRGLVVTAGCKQCRRNSQTHKLFPKKKKHKLGCLSLFFL